MSKDLHIFVTCTKRKTAAVPVSLHLRDTQGRSVEERASRWISRIDRAKVSALPAERLYCGDHWLVARQLLDTARSRGFAPRLWVISTGYGLVSIDSPLKPYSATFSPTHPDSVWSDESDVASKTYAQWWRCLSAWPGPGGEIPRSFGELFAKYSRDAFMVVASEAYLAAVRDDLVLAVDRLKSARRLVIVSGGSRNLGPLGDSLLPLDARAQRGLGGARRTLNVRMARWVLQRADARSFDAREICAAASTWLQKQPPIERYDRKRGSDDDVRAFVLRELKRSKNAAFTPLLTKYRSTGHACEQSRFRSLFNAAKESAHG